MSKRIGPDDIYELAEYHEIDIKKEPFLLSVLKQALETPLPPNWTEVFDNNNKKQFRNEQTKEILTTHPADSFFKKKIEKLRDGGDSRCMEYGAWLKFLDEKNETYYYDFISDQIQYKVPSIAMRDAEPNYLTSATDLKDSAIELHSQCKSLSKTRVQDLGVLYFQSWWNETKQNEMMKRQADIYFDIKTQHFQVVMDNSDNIYTISHILNRNSEPLEAWDLHVGAKICILGRQTTLMNASQITAQWLEYQSNRLGKVLKKLEEEVKKYDPKYCNKYLQSKTATEVHSGKLRGSTSLRDILKRIETLGGRLSEFRPILAQRILDDIYG